MVGQALQALARQGRLEHVTQEAGARGLVERTSAGLRV
jgi:hypothetical protein